LRATSIVTKHKLGHFVRSKCDFDRKHLEYTAADMTTRCAFKIEDPSRGPGRVNFRALDEGFGLEGTPKPKIQRDPSPNKNKPYMWSAAVYSVTSDPGKPRIAGNTGKRGHTLGPVETSYTRARSPASAAIPDSRAYT
jgi:hypothetical protein